MRDTPCCGVIDDVAMANPFAGFYLQLYHKSEPLCYKKVKAWPNGYFGIKNSMSFWHRKEIDPHLGIHMC